MSTATETARKPVEALLMDDEEEMYNDMNEYDEEEDYIDEYSDSDDESAYESEDDEFIAPVLTGGASMVGQSVKRLFNGPRRRSIRIPKARGGRGVTGTRNATIMTQRGPITARFSKKFVTEEQLKAALSGIRKDINTVGAQVKNVDKKATQSIAQVSKTTALAISNEKKRRIRDFKTLETTLTKKIDDSKQLLLMMTLLGSGSDTDSNSLLLPLLLLGGNSFGSGDSTSNLLLIMALSGKL